MLRNQLASRFVGVILDRVKNNGWERTISEDVGINRREFNRNDFVNMKMSRMLRVLVALAFRLGPHRFILLWTLLGNFIMSMAENAYAEFCDERRKEKSLKGL